MSTIIVLKEADTLIFGTDSRVMAHDFSGVVSDVEPKIFEIAPDTFIATSGRKMVYDFQIARARELASDLGTTDIQAIGAALDRDSLPRLRLLVERLRLETDENTKAAVSGESLLHACILVGRTDGGQLGYVAYSYRVQAGEIKCETDAYFEARRKVTATSGAAVHLFMAAMSRFAQDMATWLDPPEQVVLRFLGDMRRLSPMIGGPSQVLRLDNNGAHWISRLPPPAAVPLVSELHSATVAALVSLISPVIAGGSITGATITMTGGAANVTIHINGAGEPEISLVDTAGDVTSLLQPGLLFAYKTSAGGINSQLTETYLMVNDGTHSSDLRSTSFKMSGLPSSSPGAGSKQFWYDPSDGNRVKFAP